MKDLLEIRHKLTMATCWLKDLRGDLSKTLQETDVHPDRYAKDIWAIRQEIEACSAELESLSSLLSA